MNGGGTFKVPELPLNKRKQPPTGSSSSSTSSFNELLPPPTSNKRIKTDHSSNGKTSDPLANPSRISSGAHSSASSSKSGPAAPDPLSQYSRAARVEDEPEPSSSKSRGMEVEEEEEDDEAYGPADETFEADDGDEEGGRFFGGGTNETQERILDMFAGVADEQASTLPTIPEFRRQIIKFDRIVRRNAELRSKWVDEATKYLDSETELDRSFSFLYPIPQDPLTYYPEIISNTLLIPNLIQLLSHENTDIALQVVSALYEMTDEDVGDDAVEREDEEEAKEEVGRKLRLIMGDFVGALLDQSILELLVANLARLNEADEESDRTGVFNILGIFDNLLSFLPPLANQVVEQTDLLTWLLRRITVPVYDSNKQYASEVLAVLLQEERTVRLKLDELGGIEPLLQAVAVYRTRDPADTEELEYMENIFNALCSVLNEPELKHAFLEAEGVELMTIIMKEKVVARTRAIKVMAYATQTDEGKRCCERFVEALGLSNLFKAFMGKGGPKKTKTTAAFATSPLEDEEHVLSILASLFTSLDSETPARIRTLHKFVENDYEKIDRLLEMREGAVSRLSRVEREVEMEKRIMQEDGEEITETETDDWYLRKINAGLSHLQNIDYVLAWVAMEDDGAQGHAKMLLSRKDKSFKNIIAVLKELRDTIASDAEVENADEGPEEVQPEKVTILDALIAFCQQL